MGKVIKGFKAWRAARRYEKGKIEMPIESKPVLKSTTTQNVAAGTLGSGGVVYGALTFARSMWPQFMPWEPSQDAAIVVVLTGVIGPLVSRLIAGFRDPKKNL